MLQQDPCSDEEEDESNLSSVLSIVILEGATDLYGGTSATGTKHLNEFFSDSDAVNGVPLSTLAGNSSSTSYEFEVCFDEQAGNEFKETAVSFDLIFGEIIIPVELPDVCQDLEGIVSKKIEGTEDDDKIRGSTASELILAKGGNDRIYPGGGSDCVIAGDGNDRVGGSTGNDIIEGGNGDDRLEGGTGNDLIYGNQGRDVIRGGSGNDKIFSGEGRDTIKGGSGNDEIFGQEDDDNIRGGSGNDYLDGGSGFDKLRGDFGYDICVEGEILLSCES